MPELNIDLRQLAGIDTSLENLKTASIDFSPYQPYATDDNAWVTRNIVRVKTIDSARLPSTTDTDTFGLYSTTDHLHPRPAGTANQWMADNYVAALSPR